MLGRRSSRFPPARLRPARALSTRRPVPTRPRNTRRQRPGDVCSPAECREGGYGSGLGARAASARLPPSTPSAPAAPRLSTCLVKFAVCPPRIQDRRKPGDPTRVPVATAVCAGRSELGAVYEALPGPSAPSRLPPRQRRVRARPSPAGAWEYDRRKDPRSN